jgi:hypothetical protein
MNDCLLMSNCSHWIVLTIPSDRHKELIKVSLYMCMFFDDYAY